MESSKLQIPVNTRTVGNPNWNPTANSIYTLYIEDYVHTFMQKNLETNKNATKIALFGQYIDGKLIISGAAPSCGSVSKDKDTCAAYFTGCEYLGTATIARNDKNNMRFEIASGGIIVIVEDYYIYYDQNEQMQNYLIAWNASTQTSSFADSRRTRGTDAARFGKILQAYNREEAKVSFMWNILSLLCIGFFVCFMAYGIVTINSYNKMQSMQSGIEYCMKILDQQMASIESDEIMADESESVENGESEIEVAAQEETIAQNETNEPETAIPQYYIVQKGDTLRNICYEIYGDYGYVEKVCLWNDIEDPNNILCGQKLLLR